MKEDLAQLLIEYQDAIYRCLDAGIDKSTLEDWLDQTVESNMTGEA
jgi:hypothetical protein